MDQAFQLAPRPIYQAEKPVRNDLYQRLIKRFPCLVGGATREIDPMHTGSYGLGAKACDTACLPGCRKCRREFDANARALAERHHLDELFYHLWERKQRSPS